MASMDAQAIYENFHNNPPGTPGLSTAQQTAQQLATKYQDRALTTQQMIDGVQTGWKGQAAEAAAQGLAPLAVNSLSTHQQLSAGQDIVSRQVDSFHTAVSEVQPVPPAPQMQNVITAAVTGQDVTPMIDQMKQNYAVQASNVDAYNKYVSASQYNTSNLPPITPVDTPSAPVSVTSPPPSSSASTPNGTTHAPRLSSGSGSRNATVRTGSSASFGGGSRSSVPPTPGGGGALPPAGSPGSGSTTTSSAAPPVAPPPSQSTPVGPGGGSSPGPNRPVGPVLPVGGGAPSDGRPLPGSSGPGSGSAGEGEGIGSGSGGTGAIGDDEGGLSGIRPGTGSSTPGGLASGTNSGGGAAGEEEGVGSRSGAGPGAAGVAEEEALATEPGTASRGMTSTSAAPMGASRGGKGSEDAEHQRKYGVEEDGEALFGITERLAPPVFGETPSEREQRHADEAGRHRAEP
jgi:uncharacterized membrane protein YgcG